MKIDREYVKANTPILDHEFDGLDALYPKLFDDILETVLPRFASKGASEEARKHIASLVAFAMYQRLGTQHPDRLFFLADAADHAEKYLTAPTVSRTPTISPPVGEKA